MANVIDQKSAEVLETLLQDEKLMSDLAETKTPEEVVGAFAKHDIEIPGDLAKEIFENAHNEEYMDSVKISGRELEDGELENVTGGGAVAVGLAIGATYVGVCAVSYLLGCAYESKFGKTVRNWFKKTLK